MMMEGFKRTLHSLSEVTILTLHPMGYANWRGSRDREGRQRSRRIRSRSRSRSRSGSGSRGRALLSRLLLRFLAGCLLSVNLSSKEGGDEDHTVVLVDLLALGRHDRGGWCAKERCRVVVVVYQDKEAAGNVVEIQSASTCSQLNKTNLIEPPPRGTYCCEEGQ